MANVFPTSLNSYTGAETFQNAGHAQAHNAYETKIGTGSSTPSTNLFLRASASGITAWDSYAAIGEANYYIFYDGTYYRAINGYNKTQYTYGTDAATVINAAIGDTYNTYGGGKVKLKFRTATITTPIIMLSRIWLQGDGMGELSNATTLLQLGTNANCDVIKSYQAQTSQSYGIRVTDLQIDGNKSNQNGTGPYNGINFTAQRWTVRDVLIKDVKGRGIYAGQLSGTNSIYGFVENCSVNATTGAGIYFDYWTVNMVADHCIVENCGLTLSEAGIITNGPQNIIQNCPQIYGCYQGIAVNGYQSGMGTRIWNNVIELIQREGVYITDSPDCSIQNNVFLQSSQATNNTYACINLDGSVAHPITRTIITGNTFEKKDNNNDTSKYQKYCVTGDNEDYNLVANNMMYNGYQTSAISLTGVNDVTTPNLT